MMLWSSEKTQHIFGFNEVVINTVKPVLGGPHGEWLSDRLIQVS